jgi:hypothetical protein
MHALATLKVHRVACCSCSQCLSLSPSLPHSLALLSLVLPRGQTFIKINADLFSRYAKCANPAEVVRAQNEWLVEVEAIRNQKIEIMYPPSHSEDEQEEEEEEEEAEESKQQDASKATASSASASASTSTPAAVEEVAQQLEATPPGVHTS